MYMGSCSCPWAFCYERMVHRHAELPFPHDCSHRTEPAEHRMQHILCLCFGYAHRRCGTGDPVGPVGGVHHCTPALSALLQEVVEKEILPRSVVLALVAPGRYSGNCIQPPELLTVPSYPLPYSCAFHVHCGRSGTR